MLAPKPTETLPLCAHRRNRCGEAFDVRRDGGDMVVRDECVQLLLQAVDGLRSLFVPFALQLSRRERGIETGPEIVCDIRRVR